MLKLMKAPLTVKRYLRYLSILHDLFVYKSLFFYGLWVTQPLNDI